MSDPIDVIPEYRAAARNAINELADSIDKFNRGEFNIDFVCSQLLDEFELDEAHSSKLAVAFDSTEWEAARSIGELLGLMVQNRSSDARESEFLSDSLWPQLILEAQMLASQMDRKPQ